MNPTIHDRLDELSSDINVVLLAVLFHSSIQSESQQRPGHSFVTLSGPKKTQKCTLHTKSPYQINADSNWRIQTIYQTDAQRWVVHSKCSMKECLAIENVPSRYVY